MFAFTLISPPFILVEPSSDRPYESKFLLYSWNKHFFKKELDVKTFFLRISHRNWPFKWFNSRSCIIDHHYCFMSKHTNLIWCLMWRVLDFFGIHDLLCHHELILKMYLKTDCLSSTPSSEKKITAHPLPSFFILQS